MTTTVVIVDEAPPITVLIEGDGAAPIAALVQGDPTVVVQIADLPEATEAVGDPLAYYILAKS